MKLYTEEQVTKLTTAAFVAGQNQNPAIFGIEVEKINPIELPTEEEIGILIGDGMHNYYKGSFEEGAKWVIEQIKNQQK
jgi:hypothetical protein